jgi:hypothetical protein
MQKDGAQMSQTNISVFAGTIGVLLILIVLWDGFETIVLPRRVMRRFRLARLFYRATWPPWSLAAHGLFSGGKLDSMLGFYGPLSLLFLICVWAGALIFGFGLLYWALGSSVIASVQISGFPADLYMSGTTFFTLGLGDVRPISLGARVVTIFEAGMGFGFLALVVAYLPALNQSFSRREAAISMLDARAGSPPTAARMLERHRHEGGMDELREQFSMWEQWSAELLESHLSYPVLAHYRSQHDNQSWLAALTVVLDSSALVLAAMEDECARQAQLTFAMARHAVVDLAAIFNQAPRKPEKDRLDQKELARLKLMLQSAGLKLIDDHGPERRLQRLRESYEPYVYALARYFRLSTPPWMPAPGERDDWETSPWEQKTPLDGAAVLAEWENHHFRGAKDARRRRLRRPYRFSP